MILAVIIFLACLALLQLAHAFIVISLDGEWVGRQWMPIAIAVALDALVLIALMSVMKSL
jgi:hypothetical protein